MNRFKLMSAFTKNSGAEPHIYRLLDLQDGKDLELNRKEMVKLIDSEDNEVLNIEKTDDGRLVPSDSVVLIRQLRKYEASLADELARIGSEDTLDYKINLINPCEIGRKSPIKLKMWCKKGHMYEISAKEISKMHEGSVICPICRGKDEAEKLEVSELIKEEDIENNDIIPVGIVEAYRKRNANFALEEFKRANTELKPFEVKNAESSKTWDFKCELGHITKSTINDRIKRVSNQVLRCKICSDMADQILDFAVYRVLCETLGVSPSDIKYNVSIYPKGYTREFDLTFTIDKLKVAAHISRKRPRGDAFEAREIGLAGIGYKLIKLDLSESFTSFADKDISMLGFIQYKVNKAYKILSECFAESDNFKRLSEVELKELFIDSAKKVELIRHSNSELIQDDSIYRVSEDGCILKKKKPRNNQDESEEEKTDAKVVSKETLKEEPKHVKNKSTTKKDSDRAEEKTKDILKKEVNKLKRGIDSMGLDRDESTDETERQEFDRVGPSIIDRDAIDCETKSIMDLTNEDKFSGLVIDTYKIKANTLPEMLLKYAYFIYMTDFVAFAKIVEDYAFRYEYYDRQFRIVSTKRFEVRNINTIANSCVYVDTTLGVNKNIKFLKRMTEIAGLTNDAILLLDNKGNGKK